MVGVNLSNHQKLEFLEKEEVRLREKLLEKQQKKKHTISTDDADEMFSMQPEKEVYFEDF